MTAPPIGTGFALFDTALGRCGIAWTPRGIAAVQLPESTDERTRARLRRRLPDAPEASSPPAVRQVTSRIVALLAGNEVDLSDIRLDMDGIAPFHHAVYAAARTIPAGVRSPTARSRAGSARPAPPGRSGRRLDATRSRSSCRATALSRQAGRSAASRRAAVRAPSWTSSRSRARSCRCPCRCRLLGGRAPRGSKIRLGRRCPRRFPALPGPYRAGSPGLLRGAAVDRERRGTRLPRHASGPARLVRSSPAGRWRPAL